jgi:acyl carrier protein
MTRQDIELRTKDLIVAAFDLQDDEIRLDTPLFSSRLLRSLDVVETIQMLEQEYDIEIVALDVSIEDFDTIHRIADLVERRIGLR